MRKYILRPLFFSATSIILLIGATKPVSASDTTINYTVNNTDQGVVVDWDDYIDEDFIEYRITVEHNNSVVVEDMATTNSRYLDVEAKPNTQLTYTVSSVSNPEVEEGEPVVVELFTTPYIYELSTLHASATPISGNQVRISYNHVYGVDHYDIFRSTVSDKNFTLLGNSTDNYYIDNSVEAGTTYFYRVVGRQSVGPDVYTTNAAMTESVKPLLSKPIIVAQAVTYNRIKVTIKSPVAGATTYKYYRSKTQSGGYKLVHTSSGLHYYDRGLDTGTRYYYKVIAYSSSSFKSLASNPRSAKPVKPTLSKPIIVAQAVTYNRIKVTIKSPVAGATTYKYYRSKTQSGGYKLVDTSTELQYYDRGLDTGTRYYYKVIAYHNGSKTRSLAASPRSAKPVLNKIKNINQYTKLRTIKLKWTKITGASGYKVYRANSKNGKYKHIANASKNTYTNKGLSHNEDYWYRIKPFRRTSSGVAYGSVSSKKKSVTPLPAGSYVIKRGGVFLLQTNGIASWDRYAGKVHDYSGYDTGDIFYDKTYVYVESGSHLEFDTIGKKGSIKRVENMDDASLKAYFSRGGMYIGGIDLVPGWYGISGSDYYAVTVCGYLDLECDDIIEIEIIRDGGYYEFYLGLGEILDISYHGTVSGWYIGS